MAGSLNHMITPNGEFSFELIENMGDAYEACHEMFGLVRHLTGNDQERIDAALDEYYQRCRGEKSWEEWMPDPMEE